MNDDICYCKNVDEQMATPTINSMSLQG